MNVEKNIPAYFSCGVYYCPYACIPSDKGFDASLGAWSIGVIGLCNVFGAFLSGIWSGKISKRSLLVAIYLGRAVTIALFMLLPMTLTSVLVFSAVMDFLWLATVPLPPVL